MHIARLSKYTDIFLPHPNAIDHIFREMQVHCRREQYYTHASRIYLALSKLNILCRHFYVYKNPIYWYENPISIQSSLYVEVDTTVTRIFEWYYDFTLLKRLNRIYVCSTRGSSSDDFSNFMPSLHFAIPLTQTCSYSMPPSAVLLSFQYKNGKLLSGGAVSGKDGGTWRKAVFVCRKCNFLPANWRGCGAV